MTVNHCLESLDFLEAKKVEVIDGLVLLLVKINTFNKYENCYSQIFLHKSWTNFLGNLIFNNLIFLILYRY